MTPTASPILNHGEMELQVHKLRKLMQTNDQLKNLPIDTDYLLRFLYSCKFNVEAAFNRMKQYYELLLDFPEWFQQEGPLRRKSLIEKDIRLMTSNRDKFGRPIYLIKIGNMKTSMNLLDIISVDDIWLEYISNDPGMKAKGLSVIVDIKDFSLKLMKWMTPQNIKVGIKKLEAYPVREVQFHVVNSSYFVNIPMKIIWPFLPDKIKNSVVFHFEDWGSLHQHVDPEMLPPEYGGTGSFNFKENYQKLFVKNNEIVQSFKTFRTI